MNWLYALITVQSLALALVGADNLHQHRIVVRQGAVLFQAVQQGCFKQVTPPIKGKP